MTAALRFDQVVKSYPRAPTPALDGLTFTIPAGGITGFVGHNGAGKTTTFSIVAGYLRPDRGEVDILGRGPFVASTFKGLVGVLPQDAELPDRHTPRELLRHLAQLQGLGARAAAVESDRVLSLVQLDDRRDRRIATFSHGMRRRVAVATALVGRPPLVLLDEPLSGLDPVQAHGLRTALAELRGAQTLVVSSHDLADLERMCDTVVMLKNGRCVREGTLAEVTGRTGIVRWELGPGTVPVEALRARLPDHTFRVDGDGLVQEAPDGTLDPSSVVVMELLSAAAIPVRGVARGVGLERRFIDDVLG
ncbi:MAG: ABC transporter ATP-binding protein [Myxococcota bacterium]